MRQDDHQPIFGGIYPWWISLKKAEGCSPFLDYLLPLRDVAEKMPSMEAQHIRHVLKVGTPPKKSIEMVDFYSEAQMV